MRDVTRLSSDTKKEKQKERMKQKTSSTLGQAPGLSTEQRPGRRPRAKPALSRADKASAATERELILTAHHEAGHAVAAYVLDAAFSRVHIIADGDVLGMLIWPPMTFFRNLGGRQDEAFEKSIIVDFAGVVAAGRYEAHSLWKGGSSDLTHAVNRALLRRGDGSIAEAEAFLGCLWTQTVEFFLHNHHRAATQVLAVALLKRNSLTYGDVKEIVSGVLDLLRVNDGISPSNVMRLYPIPNNNCGLRNTSYTEFLIREEIRRQYPAETIVAVPKTP
jgi:hypothetical protein